MDTKQEGTALAPLTEPDQERNLFAELYTQELELATRGGACDLPTFFLGKLKELEAVEDAIKDQAKILIGAVASRRRALQWTLGAKFRLAVEADLKRQGGKKKSVNYMTGRAGFRASVPTLTILDEPALKEWCLKNCEAALELKIQRTTPIKEYVKATGEVPPGAHWKDAGENFYPSIDAGVLPTAPDVTTANVLEGGGA